MPELRTIYDYMRAHAALLGDSRPNRANLLASIRSFFRLRRFDPSINRGLATSTSCPQPQMTSCTQGECVPTSKTTRAAFNA